MRTTLNAGLLTTALVIGLGAVAWAATNSADVQQSSDEVCLASGSAQAPARGAALDAGSCQIKINRAL